MLTDEIMTLEECAKYLKVSVSTMYRLTRQGKLPGNKIGDQWRFKKEKLDEWLAGEKSPSSNPSYEPPGIMQEIKDFPPLTATYANVASFLEKSGNKRRAQVLNKLIALKSSQE